MVPRRLPPSPCSGGAGGRHILTLGTACQGASLFKPILQMPRGCPLRMGSRTLAPWITHLRYLYKPGTRGPRPSRGPQPGFGDSGLCPHPHCLLNLCEWPWVALQTSPMGPTACSDLSPHSGQPDNRGAEWPRGKGGGGGPRPLEAVRTGTFQFSSLKYLIRR